MYIIDYYALQHLMKVFLAQFFIFTPFPCPLLPTTLLLESTIGRLMKPFQNRGILWKGFAI
ncbi:MAG: hypothetical protein EBW82_00445 [Verrucomicrobia bacterium]|nr:hypothetical protein [Verrucomicrobiota bacterium]